MASPVTAQLILIQGESNSFQELIELHNTNQSIGRAQSCDIIWGSLQISRRHASLEFLCPKWYIRDTSTNGLSVNNIKLTKGELFPLKDADIISFIPTGAVRYRFRYVTGPSRTLTPPSSSGQHSSSISAQGSSPLPSTSRRPPGSPVREYISIFEDEIAIPDDSRSDSDHSESLLSVDPPEDFYSFSADEHDQGQSPAPADRLLSIDEDSSNGAFMSKRKHKADSSDSDNNTVDRKKKKVAVLLESDTSSDEDDSSRNAPSKSDDPIPSTSSKFKFKSLRSDNRTITDDEISNCNDMAALKEQLRKYVTKLSKTEVEVEALRCERDMEREEFRRKESDVQSVNEAFKEETYKKVLELMESELSCAVCNEVFIQATVVDCGHTFCNFCINEWARKKSECPICRKSFRNRSRHIEMENFITRFFESMSTEISSKRRANIKEREEQAKKAAEDARAAADAGARHGNVHTLMQTTGRYIDFLAELHQINEILVPRGGRANTVERRRRRSARMQDRVIDDVATGAAGGAAPQGPVRARRGRRNAAVPPAGNNFAPANRQFVPPPGPASRPVDPIVVTLDNSAAEDDGLFGMNFMNMNFDRPYFPLPNIDFDLQLGGGDRGSRYNTRSGGGNRNN